MYSLRLPPDQVSRLYRLREAHHCGPIRRQVVQAIERYLHETEKHHGIGTDPDRETAGTGRTAR